MTCKRCGNIIAGNEQFCTRCGLPVAAQPKKSGKKANVKLIVGISSGAAVLIIALIVTFVLLGRVSADKYISDSISVSGYSGYGTATASSTVDFEGLELALGLSNQYYHSDYSLSDCISYSLSNYNNISNGDVIVATITIDYDMANSLGFKKKLVGKESYTKEYTISGLTELTTIDPFAVITGVLYDKTSGKCSIGYNKNYNETVGAFNVRYYDGGYLQIVNSSGNQLAKLSYTVNSGAYVSTNKVTVSVSNVSGDEFADRGFLLKSTTQEIEPSTCDYLKSDSELSAEAYNTLKNRAIKEFTDDYPGAEYIKSYFGYDAEGDGGGIWDSYNNQLRFAFKTQEYGETRYRCAVFYDLKLYSDGTIKDIDNLSPTVKSAAATLEEIEENQTSSWQTFNTVAEK